VLTDFEDALAGPYEEIPVGKELRFMDYEVYSPLPWSIKTPLLTASKGELTVVIGKDTKDLTPEDNPLDYVLGYTVGNDVSSRYWQMPDQSGGQHGYAKSFDKFAPIGPVLVSAGVVPDPSTLSLTTKVNGELRQSTKLDDLIFDVPTIIRHLSRGTTLRKYTTIMTGTPSGVAAFMNPPAWLKDGDTVQIEISEIGVIRNKMKFLD
jgi:2-keto-4-pentenoate hydratase/2-oxohepta-3-ene-1,7-dioic acid hydratase in catechol pathway